MNLYRIVYKDEDGKKAEKFVICRTFEELSRYLNSKAWINTASTIERLPADEV